MKTIASLFLIGVILFCSCKKEDDPPPAAINCNGLITDTAGTNDTTRIYMVNAFTPNGDGINDVCRGIVFGGASFVLTIYDQNNNVLFTGHDVYDYFDPALPATYTKYYYKIQVTTAQGHHIGECGDLYAMACRPSSLAVSSLKLEDELTYSGFTTTTSDQLVVNACQ